MIKDIKSKIVDGLTKQEAGHDLSMLEFHINIAMQRLDSVEQEVVRRTAMSRQQQAAIPEVAGQLNVSVQKVVTIRRGAIQKLRLFLVNAKFPEVTRRIYSVPELEVI